MSVTLKLADEDAAVVGSILKAFSESKAVAETDQNYRNFFLRMKSASGSRTPQHIMDIAGAFQIAVRANQR